MTVCVAAICATEDGRPSGTIVTASDRLLTWGSSTSETALKAARLAPAWMTMIAGDDITRGVEDVIRAARATLAAYEDEAPGVPEVRAALLGAWRDVQNQRAETAVLNPFRLTIEQFLHMRKQLGTATFLELAEQIRLTSKLECQLLACGFDKNKVPALLVCADDSGCRDFTRADFVAIGSGDTSAVATLAFQRYTRQSSVAAAIYHVCAAKFMSEGAPGVGAQTLVLCLNEDGRTKWIFKTHVEQIRKLWEEHGRPKTPADSRIAETMAPILQQQPWREVT